MKILRSSFLSSLVRLLANGPNYDVRGTGALLTLLLSTFPYSVILVKTSSVMARTRTRVPRSPVDVLALIM